MSCCWNGFLERNKNDRVLFKYGHLVERNGKVESWSEERFCELFLKNKLYFCDPLKFNDPFEFMPKLEIKDYDKVRRKIEGEEKRKSFDHLSNDEFRAMLEEKYRELISKRGVYCLTKKWDNLLMWSHYGDSHKGYCLVFSFGKDSPEKKVLKRVKYSKARPPFIFEDEDYNDSGIKSCLSKSKCWSYEEEYRLLSQHEGYLDSPTNALKGIIFGCNMKSYIKKLISDLNNRRNRPLRLYETYPDSKEYAIRIRDYNFSKV